MSSAWEAAPVTSKEIDALGDAEDCRLSTTEFNRAEYWSVATGAAVVGDCGGLAIWMIELSKHSRPSTTFVTYATIQRIIGL